MRFVRGRKFPLVLVSWEFLSSVVGLGFSQRLFLPVIRGFSSWACPRGGFFKVEAASHTGAKPHLVVACVSFQSWLDFELVFNADSLVPALKKHQIPPGRAGLGERLPAGSGRP